MGLTTIQKEEIRGLLQDQIEYYLASDLHKDFELSPEKFKWEIGRKLKHLLEAELEMDRLPPIKNSSDIVPCAMVIPEETIRPSKQYAAMCFRAPQFTNLVRLDYYGRPVATSQKVLPYLIFNIRVAGPLGNQAYIGDVAQDLASNGEFFLNIEEALGLLMMYRLDARCAPWRGRRGDIVVGLASKLDEKERLTMPVIDPNNSQGILIKTYTSSFREKYVSRYHRFFVCGAKRRI